MNLTRVRVPRWTTSPRRSPNSFDRALLYHRTSEVVATAIPSADLGVPGASPGEKGLMADRSTNWAVILSRASPSKEVLPAEPMDPHGRTLIHEQPDPGFDLWTPSVDDEKKRVPGSPPIFAKGGAESV